MKNKLLIAFSSLFLVGCTPNKGAYKETVTVTYLVENNAVHTVQVEKGSKLGVNYIYDFDSHQEYIPIWKDEKGIEYNKDSIINKDISLEGIKCSNLNILNDIENDYVNIVGINHVHKDGKLVLLQTYYSKNIVILENSLSNNNDVNEIYLPRVINHIHSGNFQGCSNLTTIYYEGTMEQFDLTPKEDFILPSSVHIVYNTTFTIS